MNPADLHVHTIFSDGTFTPEKVVETAKEKNLSCIAICDHDCVDGIGPSIEYAKKLSTPNVETSREYHRDPEEVLKKKTTSGIEIIPGVELTVIEDSKEIHMLGYFISWKERWFNEILRRVQQERIIRMDRMIERLKARFNINVDRDKVMTITGGKGSVGRLHLAQALFQMKAVSSIQAAFNKYIGDSKPCYVEDIGFSAKEAIEIILRAKGVPILAHPYSVRDDSMVREFIKFGIRGIEAFHSDQSPPISKKYEEMAKEHNLLVTGGSDCHGLAKRGRVLLGSVKVPYSAVEKLRKEAARLRQG